MTGRRIAGVPRGASRSTLGSPRGRAGDWRTRAVSATDAVRAIRPGEHVFVGSACATPRHLLRALHGLDSAANRELVSVTQAFAIDLTGQVCADARAGVTYGGVATQPDFHRGAIRSVGGKAIVCLTSTTPDGESAIRPRLLPGEAVAFFRHLRSLTDEMAHHLCSVGYVQEMAFAAVVGGEEAERIVGTSCYDLDPQTGFADVAYMVDPDWQGAGLGQLLQTCITEYAKVHGVRGFTADVLADNARMLGVFRRSGCEVTSRLVDGAFEVKMLFVTTTDGRATRTTGTR